jgi:hypothetical protein
MQQEEIKEVVIVEEETAEPEITKPVCHAPCEKKCPDCCLSCNRMSRVEFTQSLVTAEVAADPNGWRIKMNAPYDEIQFSCSLNDSKRLKARIGEPIMQDGKKCPEWTPKIITVQDQYTKWV